MPSTGTPITGSKIVTLGIVLSFFAYWPSLQGPYHFDDVGILVGDTHINLFPPLASWMRPETRPLPMFLFALERMLIGDLPSVHRMGNIAIHVTAGWMLYLLSAVLLARTSPEAGLCRNSSRIAGLVATAWLVHPLQSQAVAYIVQRSESLMGLCFFSYLFCIVKDSAARQRYWQIAAFFIFLMGLWSKTVMVSAIAIGPLMDRAFLSPSFRELASRRGWLYGLPLIAGVFAFFCLLPGLLHGEANVGFGGDAPAVELYLSAQANAFWRYVFMVIVPVGLSIDHLPTFPSVWTENWLSIAGIAIFIASISILTIKRRFKIAFLLIAPMMVLLPTSSVIPTADIMVEHRAYTSCAAWIATIILFLHWLLTQSSVQLRQGERWLVIGASIWIGALFVLTFRRATDYASASELWGSAALLEPENDRAIQNLIHGLIDEQRTTEIPAYLEKLLRSAKSRGLATTMIRLRIGDELCKQQSPESMLVLSTVVDEIEKLPSPRTSREKREHAAAYVSYGVALLQQKNFMESERQFRKAFDIDDSSAEARALAGQAAIMHGDTLGTKEHWSRALELRPHWEQVERDLQSLQSATENTQQQ